MSQLISVAELAERLDEPGLRLFDVRFYLDRPEQGRLDFNAGHIPGARYLHLNDDLSDPIIPGTSGRHPLPNTAHFQACLRRNGVDSDSMVVVYDEGPGFFAARLWWLLRWVRHDQIRVLNGGLAAWKAANLPLSSETPRPLPEGNISVSPDPYKVIDAQTILRRLDEDSMQLLDARAPERFRGDLEPIDPIAGHIPGAANLPCAANLDGKGLWLSSKALRLRFAPWVNSKKTLVCYCGSGVTACHSVLAAVEAGLAEPVLYAGSWSEWITQPGRPVATGE